MTIPRWCVMAGMLALATSTFAFHWDPAGKRQFSTAGGLDDTSYKIVDANGTGDAVVVWNNPYQTPPLGILYQYYKAGQGWSSTRTAFAATNIYVFSDPNAFDVSMNAKGDYIIAGLSVVGFYASYKLLADLVINGSKVSDDFLLNTNVSSCNTAMSGNGDALVAYAGTGGLLARIYSANSWQPEFILAPGFSSYDTAADEFGNFIVVWNVGSAIYARRYVGGSWLSQEFVGQSEGAATDRGPCVGMYGSGGAIVAWWHSYTNYNGYVARRFNGSSWLAQETLDAGPSAGTASSRPPHLAVQPDGVAMAFFQQGTNGQQNGHLFANRLPGAGLAWEGPVDIGCTNLASGLGDGLAVDMDGYGNAVVSFQVGTNYLFRAYQATLGWLACDYQGFNGNTGINPVPGPLRGEKSIALTPHEIIGAWEETCFTCGVTLFGNTAKKDVMINGYALQTASPIVNLQVILPFNDVCGNQSPFGYTEMRFSDDDTLWSPWQPGPPFSTGTTNITGWDLTAAAYGGNAAGGLKRVYIQFRNNVCTDPATTDDEILYTGGSTAGKDIGLRAHDGANIIKIAAESGTPTSPFRITKNGTNYGIVLVPTNSPDASKFRIQTASGTKSLMKLQ